MQIFTKKENIILRNKNEDNKLEIIALSSTLLLVIFGENIEIAINKKVMSLYFLLQQKNLPWIKELTPAYASLGISYDVYFIKSNFNVEGLVFDWVKNTISNFISEATVVPQNEKAIIEIPVCFDGFLPNDLALMTEQLKLPAQEIINIFLSRTYYVFMLGFLPGFTYMGEVDGQIVVPRKPTPTPTKAGAVGIAGNQTGIYPLESLGGWHILGHTPVKMFDPKHHQPNYLQAGDKIKFTQITEQQYFTYIS